MVGIFIIYIKKCFEFSYELQYQLTCFREKELWYELEVHLQMSKYFKVMPDIPTKVPTLIITFPYTLTGHFDISHACICTGDVVLSTRTKYIYIHMCVCVRSCSSDIGKFFNKKV